MPDAPADIDAWRIDPETANVVADPALVDPVVIVVEPQPSLSVNIREVCDFLRIRVERISGPGGIGQRLRDLQPIAVLSEAKDVDVHLYDLLMSVAGYDPNLTLMVVLRDDPETRGALEAATNLWELSDVTRLAARPGIRALFDFLFHAGRKIGAAGPLAQ